jgi:hypothetical protein
MQKADQSAENNAPSQEKPRNYRSRMITYHRDGTVTIWEVCSQESVRTANRTDEQLNGLPDAEIDRIRRCVRKPSSEI